MADYAITRQLTVGTRVNEKELARLDAASRLQRLNRSDYLRQAALRMAEEDLRAAVGGDALRAPTPSAGSA